jgi:hypothetical protein
MYIMTRKEIITQTIATVVGGIILVVLGFCWKGVVFFFLAAIKFWPITLLCLIIIAGAVWLCTYKEPEEEETE